MFGAVIKDYYKEADKESGLKTVHVAVMPCSAKKYEAARDEFKTDGIPDVDYVITTQELIKMIRELGIQFNEIEPSAPDMPFSISSGAGMIFGTTGGVTEAALRRVADNSQFAMKEIEYSGIRGFDGVKTAAFWFNMIIDILLVITRAADAGFQLPVIIDGNFTNVYLYKVEVLQQYVEWIAANNITESKAHKVLSYIQDVEVEKNTKPEIKEEDKE